MKSKGTTTFHGCWTSLMSTIKSSTNDLVHPPTTSFDYDFHVLNLQHE